jgi:hypothetical protein
MMYACTNLAKRAAISVVVLAQAVTCDTVVLTCPSRRLIPSVSCPRVDRNIVTCALMGAYFAMRIQTYLKIHMCYFVALSFFNPRSEATAGKISSIAFEQNKEKRYVYMVIWIYFFFLIYIYIYIYIDINIHIYNSFSLVFRK